MINRIFLRSLAFLTIALLVAGCGGGGGATSGPTVSGVAASGSPVIGTVYLKDSSTPPREISAPIAADGSFSLDVGGMTAPFILKVTGTANGAPCTLYSFAAAAGTANVNPLSSLAMVRAAGADNLAALYAAPDGTTMRGIALALPGAKSEILTALAATLARFGTGSVDFISGTYVANHQGLDLMLDMLDLSAGNGTVTVIDRTTGNRTYLSMADFIAATADFLPQVPTRNLGHSVWIMPGATFAVVNGSTSFTAVIAGSMDQRVTWSVVEPGGGTISAAGRYTATASTGTYHVKATSVADPAQSFTATVRVLPQLPSVSLVGSGGTYDLQVTGLDGVAGISATITYDPSVLTRPMVTEGTLISGKGIFVANSTTPGMIRIAFITTTPISGSGSLVTVSFNPVPGAPSGPDPSIVAVFTDATLSTQISGATDPVTGGTTD